MHDGRWIWVATGVAVAVLGGVFLIAGLDRADKMASTVGALVSVLALGLSGWTWQRSTPRPSAPATPGTPRRPIRLGRVVGPLAGSAGEALALRTVGAATLLVVGGTVISSLAAGAFDLLLAGPLFGIPFGAFWWYRSWRQRRARRWRSDAVVTVLAAGWQVLLTGGMFDLSGPNYPFFFTFSLFVAVLLGWTSVVVWIVRAVKESRA